MQTRDEYPTGVPCFVDTGRRDPSAAMAFYGGLFDWEFENVSPEGAPRYFMASLHGHAVAGVGEQLDQTWDPMWNTYVRVDDADATAGAVAAAGGTTTLGPIPVGDAGRMAFFEDPQGAAIAAWEPGTLRGVALVNDPGSWVSNELVAGDTAHAAEFYRTVFGWETRPMGDWQMFVRPGYVEFLTDGHPEEMLAEYEQYGAPEGFADMVAYLMQGPSDRPAVWGTTFGVADADAAAERVRELGGTVVTGPTDAPWVRTAEIRDPDGTALTLSQFTPPDPG